jgi:hypothetical protein
MNNEIIEKVEAILMQLERVETKLDNVIKAMHDYDGNDEYGESSFEAFMDTQAKSNLGGPCVGHDKASWDEEEAERRMDIIGQNGNEGLHYGVEGDSNNTQPKQKQYYKNKRSKRAENKK